MSFENRNRRESIYSNKVKAGKRRTYFFDVKKTRGEDYFLTITESTRRQEGGYHRHKIFLYKEDFHSFIDGLDDCVNHIKTELMPDFDYDQFNRPYEEEEQQDLENNESTLSDEDDDMTW